MITKSLAVSGANRRGAFVLGALLVAIVIVASAISFRIYSQLDSAVALERTLIDAQRDLDRVVQAQTNLQGAVRGFVATGDRGFLDPWDDFNRSFDAGLADFDRKTRALRVEQLASTVAEIHALHASWTNEVAQPLIRDPRGRNARTRQLLGSIYVGQLGGDTTRVHELLGNDLRAAEAELKRRIDEALIGGIASIVVLGFVSIVFVTSRAQMQGEIDRERSIVETLQGAFRADLERLPGARIGTIYQSAERDGAVGGDLYDVRRLDDRRGFVLMADVSGKGIPAAVNTAFVRYSIAALARHSDDPAVVLGEFNRMFLETVADPNLFVVVFFAVLDGTDSRLTYASAGHAGAYLRRSGAVRALEVTGPMIGLDASFAFPARTIAVQPGDVVLLATDGLTESRDRAGAFLGDDGAMAILAASPETEPQAIANAMLASVRARGNGALADDLALLVIAIDGRA